MARSAIARSAPLLVLGLGALRCADDPLIRRGALATDDAKTWEARLTKADVPCSSIWRIEEIVEHPHLEHRDVLQTVDSRFGPMRLVGSGFRLAHGTPGIERPPPTLGEHSEEILREAGYSLAEIEALRARGAV